MQAEARVISRSAVAALLDEATPLHAAALRGNPAQIDHLLFCKANPMARTAAGDLPFELVPQCSDTSSGGVLVDDYLVAAVTSRSITCRKGDVRSTEGSQAFCMTGSVRSCACLPGHAHLSLAATAFDRTSAAAGRCHASPWNQCDPRSRVSIDCCTHSAGSL